MKNLLWLAALAAGALALAGPASAEDKKADDAKAIQGTWKVESAESSDGNAPPPEEIAKIKFVIDKEMITIDMGERKRPAKYKLDPGKKPKQIDIMPDEGDNKGKTYPGIYELSGDTLKLCFSRADTRPSEFAAKGDKVFYIVLKREKK